MRKIELEELKKIELEMLIYLDKICQENNIQYCLCGGSLLGAVRHKGFIPWDDDIDIFMPRKDYEKLTGIINDSDSYYKICDYRNTENYGYSMPKMMDKRTTLVDYKLGNGKEVISVFLDIFILDGLGNNYFTSLVRFSLIRVLKRMVFLSKRNFRMETIPKTIVFAIPWLICKIIGTKNINYLFDYFCKKRDTDRTKFIASFSGSYGNREIYDKKHLQEFRRHEFEGYKVSIPREYDFLLTKMYGDYMNLPPIEKRVTHHTSEEWWNE